MWLKFLSITKFLSAKMSLSLPLNCSCHFILQSSSILHSSSNSRATARARIAVLTNYILKLVPYLLNLPLLIIPYNESHILFTLSFSTNCRLSLVYTALSYVQTFSHPYLSVFKEPESCQLCLSVPRYPSSTPRALIIPLCWKCMSHTHLPLSAEVYKPQSSFAFSFCPSTPNACHLSPPLTLLPIHPCKLPMTITRYPIPIASTTFHSRIYFLYLNSYYYRICTQLTQPARAA